MPLKLRVTWRNAGTPLLPDALSNVQALVDDAPLPLAKSALGSREFDLPDGASRVVLTGSFSAAFDAVANACPQPMQAEVLRVEQAYDIVNGATLAPVESAAYAGAHPLVDVQASTAARGAALVEIKTDFVDITPFWMAYAAHMDEYTSDHEAGTELVALGSTGGDPKIWFASIPSACQSPPAEAISALVFYRPESYAYSRLDQPHDMFGLSRYLLKPNPAPEASFWARGLFAKDPRDQSRWIWVRAGFEEALAASGKAVVLLMPWPNVASFGNATTGRLPELASAALRLLWATQKVGVERGGIKLGRLALAGFSAGGLGLWTALASNERRVSEVFSFDARATTNNTATILRWFKGDPSRRLRMTGAYQLAANEAICKAVASAGARITRLPPDENAYLPGTNPRWDHACSELDDAERGNYLSDKAAWHQFSLFGGYTTDTESPAATFLKRFLDESEL